MITLELELFILYKQNYDGSDYFYALTFDDSQYDSKAMLIEKQTITLEFDFNKEGYIAKVIEGIEKDIEKAHTEYLLKKEKLEDEIQKLRAIPHEAVGSSDND